MFACQLPKWVQCLLARTKRQHGHRQTNATWMPAHLLNRNLSPGFAVARAKRCRSHVHGSPVSSTQPLIVSWTGIQLDLTIKCSEHHLTTAPRSYGCLKRCNFFGWNVRIFDARRTQHEGEHDSIHAQMTGAKEAEHVCCVHMSVCVYVCACAHERKHRARTCWTSWKSWRSSGSGMLLAATSRSGEASRLGGAERSSLGAKA